MKKNSIWKSALLSLALLGTSLVTPACSALNPTPTATAQPTLAIATTPPTEIPTIPPLPTPTLVLTSTPTLEPTATLTPTFVPPPDDFSKVALIGYGPLPDWRFMFTFQFSGTIKGKYFVETNHPQKKYDCNPETEYRRPDRLVCIGYTPAVEKVVQYGLVDAETGQIVFAGTIAVPFK